MLGLCPPLGHVGTQTWQAFILPGESELPRLACMDLDWPVSCAELQALSKG